MKQIKYLLQILSLKLNILTISMEYGVGPKYELHTKPVPVNQFSLSIIRIMQVMAAYLSVFST